MKISKWRQRILWRIFRSPFTTPQITQLCYWSAAGLDSEQRGSQLFDIFEGYFSHRQSKLEIIKFLLVVRGVRRKWKSNGANGRRFWEIGGIGKMRRLFWRELTSIVAKLSIGTSAVLDLGGRGDWCFAFLNESGRGLRTWRSFIFLFWWLLFFRLIWMIRVFQSPDSLIFRKFGPFCSQMLIMREAKWISGFFVVFTGRWSYGCVVSSLLVQQIHRRKVAINNN